MPIRRAKVNKFFRVGKYIVQKDIFLLKSLSVSRKSCNFARFFVEKALRQRFAGKQKNEGTSINSLATNRRKKL